MLLYRPIGDGKRIAFANEAVRTAVALLRPSDRFAIGTYDDQIDVVTPGAPGPLRRSGAPRAPSEGRRPIRDR